MHNSLNKDDWLGHDMYFWENNYKRVLEWAKAKQIRGEIKNAAAAAGVAVLQSDYCCDYLNDESIQTFALPDYFIIRAKAIKSSISRWPIEVVSLQTILLSVC